MGMSVRSMIFQRGHSGRAKPSGSLVLGRTTTWSHRGPLVCPPWVGLDVIAQCVAGLAGLADRLDVDVLAAAELAPADAVMPYLAALDLEADDAGALDGDNEVDLVILEVVGNALTGDDEVVCLELFCQRLVDLALGAVGEARGFGGSNGHGLSWLGVPSGPIVTMATSRHGYR